MGSVSNSLVSCGGVTMQKTHTEKLVFVLFPSNETTTGCWVLPKREMNFPYGHFPYKKKFLVIGVGRVA